MASNTTFGRATFGQLIIGLMKSLQLNNVIDSVLKLMPKTIRDWATDIRVRNFVETTDLEPLTVIPMGPLKAKQREAWQYLVEQVGADNVGDYLEFGVFTGTSMSCMFQVVQELQLNQVRFFGFDSFEGMPESSAIEDEGTWQPGQFKFGIEYTKGILRKRGVDLNRVLLTKGWFCDTWTPEFIQKHQIKKAGVIMVDCDIYSSTCDVLKLCEPLIQDKAILFFDDWNSNGLADKNLGEKKAFNEFLQENPCFTIEEFGPYTDHSQTFIVTRKQ
jgi:hypothetical protein